MNASSNSQEPSAGLADPDYLREDAASAKAVRKDIQANIEATVPWEDVKAELGLE